jgi:hypothetical protein
MRISERLRSLQAVQKDVKPRVIITPVEPMTEAEVNLAFKGSERAPWYVALIQIIERTRMDYIERASEGVDRGNAMAVARDTGAHEALNQLVVTLEKLRQSAQ